MGVVKCQGYSGKNHGGKNQSFKHFIAIKSQGERSKKTENYESGMRNIAHINHGDNDQEEKGCDPERYGVNIDFIQWIFGLIRCCY